MKVWIFSDLHLEFEGTFDGFEVPQADVCLCAGDVADGGVVPSIEWLARNVLPFMPVVFVPGNHEFYRSSIKEGLAAGYSLIKRYADFYLLDGDSVEFNEFRVVGATLWTDFELHGAGKIAMFEAKEKMADYRRIKLSKTPFRRFSPQESRCLHYEALFNIDQFYRAESSKPTVVVTHHAPTMISVPRHYLRDPLSAAFASNLQLKILQYEPVLWVHGHIHAACDYNVGKTRVICNPRGYPDEASRQNFVPNMVIDIAELSQK
ncbi:hypothetical protein BTR14_01595 [Rhizobium rhizosphaerae]|uniref:Calcineurin-like phosphoesterase domain-containing protein n=1 Tax=Xaviernesmea rhizosphaerae TaxID=1672749 RepID=A0ABX3PJ37_9HYPH|nr:metallophosphoesterase [Xaviernesmea rhizosphaerae]OQP88177.1 hypothetical protein BTR14_01595 [Xaviernesmea rhizosphaerae]